jgi:hypothetical protein
VCVCGGAGYVYIYRNMQRSTEAPENIKAADNRLIYIAGYELVVKQYKSVVKLHKLVVALHKLFLTI